jgi:hypothetical protein
VRLGALRSIVVRETHPARRITCESWNISACVNRGTRRHPWPSRQRESWNTAEGTRSIIAAGSHAHQIHNDPVTT